jgi:hypothetical protein
LTFLILIRFVSEILSKRVKPVGRQKFPFTLYRWTSLYARDRDSEKRFTYNEFAYKKTKDNYNFEDRFQENGHFSIENTRNCR